VRQPDFTGSTGGSAQAGGGGTGHTGMGDNEFEFLCDYPPTGAVESLRVYPRRICFARLNTRAIGGS
jgi:hypothetical protein